MHSPSPFSSIAPEIVLKILTSVGDLGIKGAYTLATAVPAVCKQWRELCATKVALKFGVVSEGPHAYGPESGGWFNVWDSPGSKYRPATDPDVNRNMSRNSLLCILQRFEIMSVCNLAHCRFFHHTKKEARAEDADEIASDMKIAALISARGACLKYLNIAECHMDEATLVAMLRNGMPELVEADLNFNESFKEGNGFEVFSKCPKLERLTLKCCHGLREIGINKILAACPNLKDLQMECMETSLERVIEMLGKANPLLESLDLQGNSPTPAEVERLAELPASCKNLQSLNIMNYASDKLFEQLGIHCKALKVVTVSGSQVTRQGLTHIAHGCPLLADLYLGENTVSKLVDKLTLSCVAASGPFPSLEKLCSWGMPGCTDAALEALAVACPQLREISLGRASQSTIFQYDANGVMERANMAQYYGPRTGIEFTHVGIAALGTLCSKIAEVRLGNVTLSVDYAIAFQKFPALKRLDLHGCKNFKLPLEAGEATEAFSDASVVDEAITQHTGLLPTVNKTYTKLYSVDGTW